MTETGTVPDTGATPLVVVAIFRAAPGRVDVLERELRALVAATHAEDGCLRYELNAVEGDPATMFFTETWASAEAHAAHLRTPHIRHLLAVLPDLVAEPIRELKGHLLDG